MGEHEFAKFGIRVQFSSTALVKEDLKREAIKLRTESRLSLSEIANKLNISKGTASLWLRGFVLSTEELDKRKKEALLKSSLKTTKFRGVKSKHYSTVENTELTRHQKAKIAETAVLFRLFLHGFSVYGSWFDGDKYDWVVQTKTGNFYKIQVKWAKTNKYGGLPFGNLCCTDGHNKQRRYKDGEFDFYISYDFYTDTCYVYSFEDLKHLRRSVTVHPDFEEKWDKLK